MIDVKKMKKNISRQEMRKLSPHSSSVILADRTNGRAYAIVLRLSSARNIL